MTNFMQLLSIYESFDRGMPVSMADGTTAVAEGKSLAKVAGLTLRSVLFIPNLKYNLLFVSKLTKQHQCVVTFSSSGCEFQDQLSGKMIDNAKEAGGLYYVTKNG